MRVTIGRESCAAVLDACAPENIILDDARRYGIRTYSLRAIFGCDDLHELSDSAFGLGAIPLVLTAIANRMHTASKSMIPVPVQSARLERFELCPVMGQEGLAIYKPPIIFWVE